MHIIGYHGTKVDFDSFMPGDESIDRMVGPHFGKTPAMANLFAMKNPTRKGGTARGPRYGGRVIPAKLTGRVYELDQAYHRFPGAYSLLSNRETGGVIGLFGADYHALARDIGKLVAAECPELLARVAAVLGKDSTAACLAHFDEHGWEYPAWHELKQHRDLQADIARAYRDILVERGYGVLQYVNTAKKEQVGGLDDQTCYIALAAPRFYFDEVH